MITITMIPAITAPTIIPILLSVDDSSTGSKSSTVGTIVGGGCIV